MLILFKNNVRGIFPLEFPPLHPRVGKSQSDDWLIDQYIFILLNIVDFFGQKKLFRLLSLG